MEKIDHFSLSGWLWCFDLDFSQILPGRPPDPPKGTQPGGRRNFYWRGHPCRVGGILKVWLNGKWHNLGHGAYLGPDFSPEYLHRLATDASEMLARMIYSRFLSKTGGEMGME